MERVWSNDQKNYVGARVVTGKVGQVKGDEADELDTLVLRVWGWF
jgi:hypothetical protein